MRKLIVVNEVLKDSDFQVLLRANNFIVPQYQNEWGKYFDSIESVTCLDPSKPYIPNGVDVPAYLTERKLNPNRDVKGYHTVENGLPAIYCSLARSRSIFGKVRLPLVTAAHKIGPITFPSRTIGTFAFREMGLAGVLAHEIAETAADPFIKTASLNQDSKGRRWLVEVADPVAKNFIRYTDPTTKIDVVLPDIVTKNFYKLDGVAPFSLAHSVSAPFTCALGGYAYEVKPNGATVPIK